MASERLFGNNVSPACKYCEEVFQAMGEDRLICNKRGIVLINHKCRSFVYDPLRRIPAKPLPMEKFLSSDFEIDPRR